MSEENKEFSFENEEYRQTYWHTCSHIMAQAVKRLWPEVKLAIGPSIETGFYYDLLAPFAFTPEHLEQIEAEISRLESRPAAELTPGDTKRLGMLQDTRLFEGDYFTHVRSGKGGRERLSPIIGLDSAQIIERMQNTPGEEKVWQHVHKSADIHGYRAEYATAMYKAHARPIEEIPYDRVNKGSGRKYQSEVYICRKDEAGRKLDKAAMLICSKALGHNRIEVVANNYIRGL